MPFSCPPCRGARRLEGTARSHVMLPALLPANVQKGFSTVISDVATTGNSGSPCEQLSPGNAIFAWLDQRSAHERSRSDEALAGGRHGDVRPRLRGGGVGRRRGGLQHRDDRLRRGAHRPFVPRPDPRPHLPAGRQLRRSRAARARFLRWPLRVEPHPSAGAGGAILRG